MLFTFLIELQYGIHAVQYADSDFLKSFVVMYNMQQVTFKRFCCNVKYAESDFLKVLL